MHAFSANSIRASAVALGVMSVSLPAFASHPIVFREFEFDSESSRLFVTGGFAGVSEVHGIEGTFGLAMGYEENFPFPDPPTLDPFAAFVGVDATLTGPGLLAGADLDATLNLTGLAGTFDILDPSAGLIFTGVDGQAAPMSVRVTLEGQSLHLVGQNEPSCCDFFSYRIDAFASLGLPGDLNGDGFVGVDDLNVVLSDFGYSMDMPFAPADATGDGYVGVDDLNTVLVNWNTGAPLGDASATVPEPITVGWALPAAACWVIRRRR